MDNYNTEKFDPKAANEARKQEMDALTQKLEAGVKDVFKNDVSFKAYLDFCAKLPRYSINNQMLIMIAKPDATMCQSFNNWKEMGRHVKAGEKGIRILAPAPYKTVREQDKKDEFGNTIMNSNGEPVKENVEVTVNAFKPVSTFDISQTEGDPVPEVNIKELVGSVEGFASLIEAIKEAVGVPVEFEKIESGAKGYFNVEDNRIAINEGMSEAQTVKTLLHEASHAMLHSRERFDKDSDKKSRNQKETEAEGTAYVCCEHYGIKDAEDYSFPYIATWAASAEVPELKASLDTIRGAAAELIKRVDEKLQSIVANKSIDQMQVEGNPFEDKMPNPDSDKPIKLSAKNEKPSVKEKLAKNKEKIAKTPRPEKNAPAKGKEAI